MVKLASVRATRLYGPPEQKELWEDVNAFGYVVAALLLTAGSVLLIPGFNATGGLWLILIALVLILCVNLHDLYAQLAGFDFRLPLVTLDPQLAFIEISTPLIQSIGAIVYFMGAFFLLRIARGDYSEDSAKQVADHAYGLLIAAPALWLLGSILNAFQLYEHTELEVQAYQKGVTIPFVLGSLLLLLSGIVSSIFWPSPALRKAETLAAALSVAGTALYLGAAVVNAMRVVHLQQIQHEGGRVEGLRGGAQEALDRSREEQAAYAPVPPKDDHYREIESGQPRNPYRSAVVPAEEISR